MSQRTSVSATGLSCEVCRAPYDFKKIGVRTTPLEQWEEPELGEEHARARTGMLVAAIVIVGITAFAMVLVFSLHAEYPDSWWMPAGALVLVALMLAICSYFQCRFWCDYASRWKARNRNYSIL